MSTTASSELAQVEPPYAVRMQMRAAAELGLTTRLLDPAFGYLYELSDGNGFRRALVGAKLPLNDSAAAQIASDKHYSSIVLSEAGLRCPATVRALSPRHFAQSRLADHTGLESALQFTAERGYPLIVKPNRLSHGRRVRRVDNERELRDAIESVFELDSVALVQELVGGREYRLDFVDGEFLAGYERHAAQVTGDGRSTIAELLGVLDARFATPKLQVELTGSPAWQRNASAHDLSLDSILERGRLLKLDSDVLNLNRGAVATLVDELPQPWLEWCRRVGNVMNLRFFGIDLRIPGAAGLASGDPADAVIIEVNSTPLLVQLAKMGHEDVALAAHKRVLAAVLGRDVEDQRRQPGRVGDSG